jgi:hypothetical protein
LTLQKVPTYHSLTLEEERTMNNILNGIVDILEVDPEVVKSMWDRHEKPELKPCTVNYRGMAWC